MDKIIENEEILTETGFYWRERDGVKVLVCRPLEEAGFVNGFSTRLGGVSHFPHDDLNLAGFNEDAAENIYENRRRFLNVFDGRFALATVWQVHGSGVVSSKRRKMRRIRMKSLTRLCPIGRAF